MSEVSFAAVFLALFARERVYFLLLVSVDLISSSLIVIDDAIKLSLYVKNWWERAIYYPINYLNCMEIPIYMGLKFVKILNIDQ